MQKFINTTEEAADPYRIPTVRDNQAPAAENANERVHEATQRQKSDLLQLEHNLTSKNALIRSQAEEQLRSLNHKDLRDFIDFEHARRKRRIKLGAAAFVSLYVAAVFMSIALHKGMFIIFTSSFSGLVGVVVAFSRPYKSSVIALSRFENTESVGELIAALEINDTEVQSVVRAALIRLLPRLKASDSPLLDSGKRKTLLKCMRGTLFGRHLLRSGGGPMETMLNVAILKALQQVGDESFLPLVEEWASGGGEGIHLDVREAAVECLPYLKALTERSALSSELMRPSEANHVGRGETLLRPLTVVTEEREDEMLRPSSRNE